MTESKPYRIGVKVGHMEGTSLPADWLGAYVNVYVFADKLVDAIAIAESALLEDCYMPLSTIAGWEIELDDIEKDQTDIDDDEVGPSLEDFDELRTKGGVIYTAFYGYLEQGKQS